jgi:hypothetical protein
MDKTEVKYGCVNDLARIEDFIDNTDVYCGVRDEGEEFVEGTAPKKCFTEADCKLENGSFSRCICGLDGSFYCEYPNGHPIFDDYWNSCEENDGKVSKS